MQWCEGVGGHDAAYALIDVVLDLSHRIHSDFKYRDEEQIYDALYIASRREKFLAI